MKVSNKKIVVVVLLIIELTSCYLMYQSSKKNIDLAKVTYEEETTDSMFAMYVENEETGEYDEYTASNYWPSGYKLNESMTMCIDNKGNNITVNSLIFNDNKMTVQSNKTVFCYLYFDKDNRVYTQVRSDYKNSNGALLLSETESDEYPVYYYSGNITNNNILYANFCWKMVRTTETGGVKLIYNGEPDTAEDGTLTCDNTGEESQIGTSKFNSNANSLAYAGYMHNNVYSTSMMGSTPIEVMESVYSVASKRLYSDTATWNAGTRQYELSNSDGSEVVTYIWNDNYNDLVGYYTCLSSTETECTFVYYIPYAVKDWMYYLTLSEGKTKDDYKIKLATSVIDNEDGTFTLVNPVEVSKADWSTARSNYKDYYYCEDLISETCENVFSLAGTSNYSINGYSSTNNYKYGNSFKYENGTYKLVDTNISSIMQFWDWPNNYNKINNNHYTCFNESGECEQIYYIYLVDSINADYITLSDGKTVETAINEMLYAEDVNKTDSTIKDYIDTWYENNIVDVTDSNEKLYSDYLENAIFCNNREITNLDTSGWNPNGGNVTKTLTFNYNSLECESKTDQFTLKVESGGTEGYGNNALDYPIGLVSLKEYNMSSQSCLGSGFYWMLSPTGCSNVVGGRAGSYERNFNTTYGVRPAISLSNKVEILSGNGEADNPYQVTLLS